MTFARTIADTTATRNELRLVVIAQWIAAGRWRSGSWPRPCDWRSCWPAG
jgi:hypothetical protein